MTTPRDFLESFQQGDVYETHEEWGMRQFNLTLEQVRKPDVYQFIKQLRYSTLYGVTDFPEVG